MKPRFHAVVLMMLLWTSIGSGQVVLTPDGPRNTEKPLHGKTAAPQSGGHQGDGSLKQVTVSPAAEPRLPLAQPLLVPSTKRIPGNAAPFYYRAMMHYRDVTNRLDRSQTSDPGAEERIQKLLEAPLDELSIQEARTLAAAYTNVFESLKIATHRETCEWDWRLQDNDGFETLSFLLPELTDLRNIARLLAVRTRVEISEQRYEEAIGSIRMGLEIAQDAASPPTLINDMVGMAICNMFCDRLLELTTSPNCPNLYWSIATLPRPLIPLRMAMEYEMSIPQQILPWLVDPASRQLTADQWQQELSNSLAEFQKNLGQGRPGLAAVLGAAALVAQHYPAARRDLEEWGYDPQQLETMPPAQVVAIHESELYQYTYQQMFKWALLPDPPDARFLQATEEKLKQDGYLGANRQRSGMLPVASSLMPALAAAGRPQSRLQSRLAGLQLVEAIRMYAATHEGQLPSRLKDIQAVPLPPSPFPEQPFEYRLEGRAAQLVIPADRPESVWRLRLQVRSASSSSDSAAN